MSAWGRICLLALASAAILAGCGSDDSIPSEDGSRMITRLDEVERAVAEGKCDGARASADELVRNVDALPEDVDSDVRELLERGSERLVQLTSEQCEPAEEPEIEVAPPEEPTEEPPIDPEAEEEPEEPEEEGEDRNDDRGGTNRGSNGGGGAQGSKPPSGGADGGTRAG